MKAWLCRLAPLCTIFFSTGKGTLLTRFDIVGTLDFYMAYCDICHLNKLLDGWVQLTGINKEFVLSDL